jgi:RNA polymerase sigma factor (sigma-70 family)
MVNIVDPVGVDTRMLQDEEYGEVVSAVMQLPAREREVILRAYWEGDTFTKIAEDTGLSVSWISRQHQKALERLRKEIG